WHATIEWLASSGRRSARLLGDIARARLIEQREQAVIELQGERAQQLVQLLCARRAGNRCRYSARKQPRERNLRWRRAQIARNRIERAEDSHAAIVEHVLDAIAARAAGGVGFRPVLSRGGTTRGREVADSRHG